MKARLLERLRLRTDWALISGDGTVSALLDTFADSEAELARYMEYLLAEKKWTTAQNTSSLIAQSALIGRKPRRKRSATGYVVISHTDASGVSRLDNFGQTFFNLDDRSDYDNITKDESINAGYTQALVPWTHEKSYVIPRGTRFSSSSGVEFIATETLAIKALKTPYDAIVSDPIKLQQFVAGGGWDGIKYLKVPVIQGVQRSQVMTTAATGAQFENFLLAVNNCEDASNNISSSFLRLEVSSGGTTEDWVQIPDLSLAGPFDKVYEVSNLPDYAGVIFKVGDGITGKLLPAGASVTVYYLESAGADGNISKKYQMSAAPTFADDVYKIDPRTGSWSSFLSVTNTVPLLGGEDEESEEDIRQNAPLDYLKYYAVATTEAYEEQIKAYTPIGLNKVKVYPGSSSVTFSADVLSTTSYQNSIYVTAISANGEKLEDPENQFMRPIATALGELKAPSDVLVYAEPNFIRMRLNSIVYSDATDVSDEEIKAIEKQSLLDRYSIFNTDFKSPFHESEFVSIVQSFPFVTYTTSFMEGVADVEYESISDASLTEGIYKYSGANGLPTLYSFKFKFDTIFAQNLYFQGFENYQQSAPYLLRVDLKIKNDPVKAATKNRTFFLFDDRNLYPGAVIPTVEEAKYLSLTGNPVLTTSYPTPWRGPNEKIDPTSVTLPGLGSYRMFDRVARVAQFPLISEVTDSAFMASKVKSFSQAPFEIRPWVVDSTGAAVRYNIADVAPADRILRTSSSANPSIYYCNKKDSRFISYLDIKFSENYGRPDESTYAAGELLIPGEYFEFNNIDIEDAGQFINSLKNFVTLKVYAKPLAKDLLPTEWNEIMFAEDDDIIIDRVKLT